MARRACWFAATGACCLLAIAATGRPIRAQPSGNPGTAPAGPAASPLTEASPDSSTRAAPVSTGRRSFAAPTRRWLPRHVSLGVGGVATSAPGNGTTYSPTMGGVFDLSVIGYLTPRVTWRAEGFLHLHDRSRADETALLAEANPSCGSAACANDPRETSRRTSGGAFGVEYHPMRGTVGVYGVALLGLARSASSGEAGDELGLAPTLGIGLLAPMSAGLDGFALELRWRRIPTALGAVNAAVASLQLRF